LLDFHSGVMSKASFSTFLTASEVLRVYVVRWAGYTNFICNLFLFYMQLLSSRLIAQNVKAWFKKHAWEVFQYTVVLFSLMTDSNWILTTF